jgi:hypothetical protein
MHLSVEEIRFCGFSGFWNAWLNTFLWWEGCCGDQACPALGCVAALLKMNAVCQEFLCAGLGLLRSPTQGKPARHRRQAAIGDLCCSG